MKKKRKKKKNGEEMKNVGQKGGNCKCKDDKSQKRTSPSHSVPSESDDVCCCFLSFFLSLSLSLSLPLSLSKLSS